jgi:hypothetical protein
VTVVVTPVPESATTFGLPAAFVVIVTVPVRVPATVGVKTTLRTQLAPGMSAVAVEQFPVPLKSPVNVKAVVMERFAFPVLVRVSVFAALAVPTVTEPKLREVGESERMGAETGAGAGVGAGAGAAVLYAPTSDTPEYAENPLVRR